MCPTPVREASRAARRGRLLASLYRPVDPVGLVAFRVLFGLLMFAGLARFLTSGWIPRFYSEPTLFFSYWGFEWVKVPPVWAVYVLHAVLAVLALCIAAGLLYRVSCALFFIGFSYAQLCDVTNYLNHYYLVALLSLLLSLLPLHRAWSVDARLRPSLRRPAMPAWCLYLLRFQVGIVYVFAGLAKLTPDWLLHAQPLGIWLSARTETPIIGPVLSATWAAYTASWFGFLFDTTIVAWLSWRRTRPWAYAVVLAFHALTHVFFNIGMFPLIMCVAATVFFDPGWPRRLLRRLYRVRGSDIGAWMPPPPAPVAITPARKLGLITAAVYAAVQIAIPLRHYAYPGGVLWNEQGMRWAWKVMVREKHGAITYYVRFPDTGKQLQISPRQYLDPRQEREMAGQPDLILQLAHRIAADFRARGHGDIEVRAEARVSLNGRPAHLLIDPSRDLTRVHDDLAPADWILPEPDKPPLRPGQRGSR